MMKSINKIADQDVRLFQLLLLLLQVAPQSIKDAIERDMMRLALEIK